MLLDIISVGLLLFGGIETLLGVYAIATRKPILPFVHRGIDGTIGSSTGTIEGFAHLLAGMGIAGLGLFLLLVV